MLSNARDLLISRGFLRAAHGYQRHGHGAPAMLATAGIALLALGIFAARTEWMETLLSVPGALILAIGHGFNWRAMRF